MGATLNFKSKADKMWAKQFIREIQRLQVFLGVMQAIRNELTDKWQSRGSSELEKAFEIINQELWNRKAFKQSEALKYVLEGMISPANLQAIRKDTENTLSERAHEVAQMFGYNGDIEALKKALWSHPSELLEEDNKTL